MGRIYRIKKQAHVFAYVPGFILNILSILYIDFELFI